MANLQLATLTYLVSYLVAQESASQTSFNLYYFIDNVENGLVLLGDINVNKLSNNPSHIMPSDTLSIKNDIVVGGFKPGENVNLAATFVPHAGSLNNKFWSDLSSSCLDDGFFHIIILNPEYPRENNLQIISDPKIVQTMTKSCLLMQSNVTCSICLTFNQLGHLISANIKNPYFYSPAHKNQKNDLVNHLPIPNEEAKPDTATNIRAFVQQMVSGPVPDTQTWLQRLELEKAEKTKSAYGEKNSFLGKYWLYIVIFFVFVLLSGAMNPESGGNAR